MAYPVIEDCFRAQVIMHGSSGLPEDQYVNNWYFINDDVVGQNYRDVYDAIKAQLEAFYGATNGTAGGPVASFISEDVVRVSLKVYDLGFPPPRYPIDEIEEDFVWTGNVGNEQPGELACVMSFTAGQGPRKRGRIYLGPFNTSANEVISGRAVPSSTLRLAIAESAVNVLNSTENVTWAVCSPTNADRHPVTAGWVDDAWDIQRSRGRAPQNRRPFDAAGSG